ncbi:DNA polymerase III subunit delta' [Cytobacillus sp. Hm23]
MFVVNDTWDKLETYQPTIIKMLTNSILKDRVAHAYIFEGGRGTGKKHVSLMLAKSMLCKHLNGSIPCQNCINCRRVDSKNHPDVHIIEPDGQSIKKSQIQDLQSEFSKTGVESSKKLYIIEHADRMTTNAANSLLKFLEEPDSDTIAILLTENIQKMLNTIISRCQVLSFQPIASIVMKDFLLDKGAPPHLAALVAQMTNNFEEATELCQDDWFAQSRMIVIQLYEMLNMNYAKALLYIQEKWLSHFNDKDKLDSSLDLLLLLLKDLLYIQLGENEYVVYTDQLEKLNQYALHISQNHIAEQMSAVLEAKSRLHTNMNPHLLMEQLVLNLQEGF